MTRLIEDPVLRQRYSFERRDDVLIVDMWVDPGGGVTPHVHPAMEERFRVLEGRPEFLAGRTWSEAAEAVVPPGTRHAFRNRGDVPAHIVCEVRPPSTLQEFLEAVAGLSRSGAITRAGLPRTPKGAVQAAVVAHHHRDMVKLGFPLPPPAALVPLAKLGERLGYRADAFRDL
jgi:mannose-6-phosphate isomerase-like protein (cupin superfamily)